MESNLRNLLQQCREAHNLTEDDIEQLALALADDHKTDYRPLVYSILGLIFAQHDSSSTSTKVLADYIQTRLDSGDLEAGFLRVMNLLESLFQINGSVASEILADKDIIPTVMGRADGLQFDQPILVAIAALISQACSIKTTREQIASHCLSWLQRVSSSERASPELRVNALNALIKLSYRPVALGEAKSNISDLYDLAINMKDTFLGTTVLSTQTQAVEGLAYASSDPRVKELLANDSAFLFTLLRLAPKKPGEKTPSSSVHYGIVMIMVNLTAPPPILSEEEAQVRGLQKFTLQGKANSQGPDINKLEDMEHVRTRVSSVLRAGGFAALSRISRQKCSEIMLASMAAAWLNFVENKVYRGHALQAGATKSLFYIIRSISNGLPREQPIEPTAALMASQALAKLAITSAPSQVFGPDGTQAIDAIVLFRQLLLSTNSSLLQKFESLMALTNLVTFSPEIASRIARSDGLLERVQGMFLDSNTLVRRASTELICNLVGATEEAFNEIAQKPRRILKSKIHIVVALSDVEDVPTRLASSAILAILSGSSAVCSVIVALHAEKKTVLDILLRLLNLSSGNPEGSELTPNPGAYGFYLRGATCISNILANCGGEKDCKALIHDAIVLGLEKDLAVGMKYEATREISENLVKLIAEHS